jgi:LacI family transcriptional regulator
MPKLKSNNSPTIFDIAKKAGVSITTVSRALNGFSDVNEKTRKRIVEIAEDLRYYPNAAARNLQGKRTDTIAFAPSLGDHSDTRSFFKEFVGTLALASFNHNLGLLVTGSESVEGSIQSYRELAGSGRVDGLILADITPQDERVAVLQELALPFVVFGRTDDYEATGYPLVDVDGAAGIAQMIDYLVNGDGHRRIAYLNSSFNTSYSRYRYQGYCEALGRHGLMLDERLVVPDLPESENVQKAVEKLFNAPEEERPTAIVTDSDALALSVVQSLLSMGLKPGKKAGQVAVTGFDDLPFAAFLQPGLTTVRQPIETTCQVLLDLLVAIIRNEGTNEVAQLKGITRVGERQFLLTPALVIRDSA